MHRRLSVALVAVVALLAFATPAAAANPAKEAERLVEALEAADDPYVAFDALTSSEQQLVLDYTRTARVVTDASVSPRSSLDRRSDIVAAAAVRCWTWAWNRQGWNIFGTVIWQFNQQIDWCGDGVKITSTPFRRVWASRLGLFWTYHGLVENVIQGGKGFQTYRSFVQGSFTYCPPPGVCWQNSLPWLDMKAWADGRGTGSGGG